MKGSLLLSNAKLVTGQTVQILIDGHGIISEFELAGSRNISFNEETAIIDCTDMYVSSGWIDMHVHAFSDFSPYGDEIDDIGVKQGVTTIVDAGSCGADRIGELEAKGKAAQTNLLAFLNISKIGLSRIDELSSMDWLDEQLVRNSLQQYASFIVGLKARMSKSVVGANGLKPLYAARAMSQAFDMPLMVHIGSGPPAVADIISLLERKDIVTHYLNGKSNNLFDLNGKPLRTLMEAIKRGVCLDVGHGSASFCFRTAEAAKLHGIPLGTISTDIYRKNRLDGPVYSLANVLSKFLYLGYSLQEIITAVTARAADWLGKPELGRIQIGDRANLTLFSVENEQITLRDSEGEERLAERSIITRGAVVNDNFIEC